MKNILFIGGTGMASFFRLQRSTLTSPSGYIGGPILSRFLEREDSNLKTSALVRSPEKAIKLRSLNGRLNIMNGSHNDAELVEKIVSDADIVFSLVQYPEYMFYFSKL
jgi:nucleoside-diphosphate-sugar epimerase